MTQDDTTRLTNGGSREKDNRRRISTVHTPKRMLLPLFVALGLLVSSFGGVAATSQDLPTITVGSKDFTEQIVVAEMVALLLEDAGYPVERQLNLGGTLVVHEALVNGDIDAYVEYTGTGLLAILGMELPVAEATPAAGGATPAASGVDPGLRDRLERVPVAVQSRLASAMGVQQHLHAGPAR